jgi:ABC-type branched-subunit amino acid transport system substrate-binding protein
MTSGKTVFLIGAVLLASPANAAPRDIDIVRDLATRIGPIIGSASACDEIAGRRIQTIADKFSQVIREASASEADRAALARWFDAHVATGRKLVTTAQIDCKDAERQLAGLEQSLGVASPSPQNSSPQNSPPAGYGLPSLGLSAAAAATAPTANIGGITDREIRFGMVLPFSGARKEAGRQMKIGIEAAFNRANDAGGINGRTLRLVTADDGYEPSRTLNAMKQLHEKDQVFGFIGNIGTATAAVGIPYALEQRALFFGPFTGAAVVRHDPPDRYVFNYRASYAEETGALVRYLVKLRRLQPGQIAVLAQQDPFGDDGFAGVTKAFRALGLNDAAVTRFSYPRNTIDVDDAVNRCRAQKGSIRAVIIIGTDRAAAKFIEKTHDVVPDMTYANVSAVGASSLANELMLLGPRYTNGVIVTQGVPAASCYSSMVLEYKAALAKYAAGEAPDYTSLEGYISATILIQALKRTGPQLDIEKLVDTLAAMDNIDLGVGAKLGFGRAEHQASHKIWATTLDETGTYQPIDLE